VLRWCALYIAFRFPCLLCCSPLKDCKRNARHCACDCGRFAESEDPVLFASYGEVDKCEFIKVNAPEDAWEAWSSTDDGAGLLVKADALREQAREVLVRAARFPHSRAAASLLSPDLLLPICPPPLALLRDKRCALRRRRSLGRKMSLRRRSRKRRRRRAAAAPQPFLPLLTYY
jgi:hypothetical protein